MYTFLCQKINNEISLDFVLATVSAVNFVNWYNNEEIYKVKFVNNLDDYKDEYNPKLIPVGSIEFVREYYLEKCKIKALSPINIPKELIPYTKRKVWLGTEKEKITKPTFCKSMDSVKGFTDIIDSNRSLKKGNYIFSELIDIESEWRCFVLKGELLGVHNYINSLGLYPNIEEIRDMLSKYNKLEAYTLDVGVNKEVGTFVIEVHDFYSCGLYGFSNHNKLLQMLIASHKQKF